jgi:hypothetical protein
MTLGCVFDAVVVLGSFLERDSFRRVHRGFSFVAYFSAWKLSFGSFGRCRSATTI